MQNLNNQKFEGTVQSVYIETKTGGFRQRILDDETGQILSINKEGLVKLDRTSDAVIYSSSDQRENAYIGSSETVKITQEEKNSIFNVIENLFKDRKTLENWCEDGPYLKVVLTNTEGKKFIYEGWTQFYDDNGFSNLLRQYTGFDYLEGLDGEPTGTCSVPFIKPNEEILDF